MLIDEIEKVWGAFDHDGGTSRTMFSQVLWWLAEHRSRVLTIMTTNAAKSLPKELFREGRVDRHFWFGGLELNGAKNFIVALAKTFPEIKGVPVATLHKVAADALTSVSSTTSPKTISQATLTVALQNFVKNHVLNTP